MQTTSNDPHPPWWKNGFVWMIIGGPAIVVIASLVTYYLAASNPNEIVSENYQPKVDPNAPVESLRKESSTAPAMMGRNHATTGVVPAQK